MQELAPILERLRPKFEEDLFDWLRIPSVSADSRHAGDVVRAAEWLLEQCSQLGLAAERIETGGHPLVYAESAPVPGKPVVLVYGHYDVQPPDPLEEWTTPPFEPTVRDGNVYARGATDDKGQFLTHLQSIAAWRMADRELPLQIKFLVEGEEEVGSENLERFLREQPQKLGCDCVVISDTSQFGPDRPAITYGLRGIAYYEVHLQGPAQDLHSGVFGGAVTNPANALAALLAALVDKSGHIQIPGFYDDVVPLTDAERTQFRQLGFDEQEFQRQIGVSAVSGEEGFSTLERRWARPSCDVHGLTSGYQGEGAKTVLPATASAKLSFRLVPRQDPRQISIQLREFLQSCLPAGVTMELVEYHGAPGVLVPLESPFVQAAARAIEDGFGTPPVWIREGGSIPIVTSFAEVLGTDVLLLGWGQNDDNAHSPDEKFKLADYHRGIRASCSLWFQLAASPPQLTA